MQAMVTLAEFLVPQRCSRQYDGANQILHDLFQAPNGVLLTMGDVLVDVASTAMQRE